MTNIMNDCFFFLGANCKIQALFYRGMSVCVCVEIKSIFL